MSTPDSESFDVPLDTIIEWTNGGADRLQKPLDDALIRAKQNALDDAVEKNVIIKIIPEGATNPGATSTVTWSQEICREYLWPPGNSTRMQNDLENRLEVMGRSASTNFTVTATIIRVLPT